MGPVYFCFVVLFPYATCICDEIMVVSPVSNVFFIVLTVAALTAFIIAKFNSSLLSNVPLRIVKGNYSFFPALHKGEEKYGVG